MAIVHDRLPYTPAKRQPKRKIQPSPDAFKAATERLDKINAMAGAYRAPAYVQLLSDDESGDLALHELHEAARREW
jgi:hypothetical protein